MKFSRSLLESEDIKNKIYQKGIEKSKQVLVDIFSLDFSNSNENQDEFNFDISFIFNGRKIDAKYYFDEDKEDMVNEVLLITEKEHEVIELNNLTDDSISNISMIQNILEKRYELNFTPLDPGEEDANIIDIESTNNSWKVTFNQDFHEGKTIACYNEGDSLISLEILKEHKIYID